jgi:hypothetical protein
MGEKFNGHASWREWNVALWLSNDERLYRLATSALHAFGFDRDVAARALLGSLPAKTPDGAPVTLRAVRLALDGFDR